MPLRLVFQDGHGWRVVRGRPKRARRRASGSEEPAAKRSAACIDAGGAAGRVGEEPAAQHDTACTDVSPAGDQLATPAPAAARPTTSDFSQVAQDTAGGPPATVHK